MEKPQEKRERKPFDLFNKNIDYYKPTTTGALASKHGEPKEAVAGSGSENSVLANSGPANLASPSRTSMYQVAHRWKKEEDPWTTKDPWGGSAESVATIFGAKPQMQPLAGGPDSHVSCA